MNAMQSFFQRHGFTLFLVVALLGLYLYFQPKEKLPAFLIHQPAPTHVGAPLLGQDAFNQQMSDFLAAREQTKWVHLKGSSTDGTLDLLNQWLATVDDWKVGFMLHGAGLNVDRWLPKKPTLMIVPMAAGNGFAIEQFLAHVTDRNVPIEHDVRIIILADDLPPSYTALAEGPFKPLSYPSISPPALNEADVDTIHPGLWQATKGNRGLISLAQQQIADNGSLESDNPASLLVYGNQVVNERSDNSYLRPQCQAMIPLSAMTWGFDEDDVKWLQVYTHLVDNSCKSVGENQFNPTTSVSPAILNNYLFTSTLGSVDRNGFHQLLSLAWFIRPEETRFSISSALQANPDSALSRQSTRINSVKRLWIQPMNRVMMPTKADNTQYWLGVFSSMVDDANVDINTLHWASSIATQTFVEIKEENGAQSVTTPILQEIATIMLLANRGYQRLERPEYQARTQEVIQVIARQIPNNKTVQRYLALVSATK